jgi:hypothetical protein
LLNLLKILPLVYVFDKLVLEIDSILVTTRG